MSLEAYRGLHRHETTRRQRIFTRAERARLSTLENPLLYSNFVKKLEKLNPDIFDPDWIDRTLEPEEALLDLKRKHPELDIGLKEKEQIEGFREFLDEIGITNERLQNMIAMEDSPLSEDELNQLAYILQMRSEHAQKTDMALKAPLAKDVRTWIANPNRVDIKTVDQ
ncbi:hypothetical protein [Candidatus Nitrososphaera gargensis]|uniref:hypothetical protein n=1 Tax=Candidatus Nitrososphaera gargensis TaxID=497727 RepID=UPI0011E51039|nr:hypothetical protein [Candidatus Nitrososphaera gargensis]